MQVYTVNKRLAIFPSPAGMLLTELSLTGIIKLFPVMESLVSDIPAGDGKIAHLFYSVCTCVLVCCTMALTVKKNIFIIIREEWLVQ